MKFDEWAATAINICGKFNQVDDASIEYLLQLMSTFRHLYACIFSQDKIIQKLYEDIDNGINCTRRGMVRLNYKNDNIRELLTKEIAFHNGDLNKCKDKKTSVVLSILWLDRVLWFLSTIMQLMLKKELDDKVIRKAYDMTIRKYHNWISEQAISSLFTIFSGKDGIKSISNHMDQVKIISKQMTKVHLKVYKIIRDLRLDFADKM